MIYVDGYNLLHLLDGMSREALIEHLGPYAKQHALVLVFDSPNMPEGLARHHIGALEVVYTASDQTADEYLMECICAHKHPASVTVVTADRRLQMAIKTEGAKVVLPKDFWARIHRRKSVDREDKPCQALFHEQQRWWKIFHKPARKKR